MCVCTKRVVYGIPNSSEMQCYWLSHVRPAPVPFPLFLFPDFSKHLSLTEMGIGVQQEVTGSNPTPRKIYMVEG